MLRKKYLNLYFLSICFIVASCSTDKSSYESPSVGEDWNGFLIDNFDKEGDLTDYITNNADALPNVKIVSGRYRALLDDNTNNVTLHFNDNQGRLDAKLLTFPFEFIARNIGIGTVGNSQEAPSDSDNPYIFCGIQIHVKDMDSRNSSHIVVGHRGPNGFTIEGKNTLNGSSDVNDIEENTVPLARADIRIVGKEDNSLQVYWRAPDLDLNNVTDNWELYKGTGNLPGNSPSYENEVYVGLITYAFGQKGIPFVGTCDAIQIKD